ncbi:VOC family protein [Catenovulum sp. 2E275]|uniref:VOC family protein n=1 Tax=Catenovulum sp. 2E275 TaxID=2980497 RepID=UPI0021D28980|nr:VOC family protein [Catenovulum sp. 2E275]MCU4675211.1 VOC family protein [Catenovulum sp. 2E275]
MKFKHYINFNGNCKQAFEFYADVFDGTINFSQTWGDTPELNDDDQGCAMPQNWQDKIMHAELQIGENYLLGVDADTQYEVPQGISICINFDSEAQIEAVYQALELDAQMILMPLAETFWAQRFAVLTDKFGVPWKLNLNKS